jgi:hypothetical protein
LDNVRRPFRLIFAWRFPEGSFEMIALPFCPSDVHRENQQETQGMKKTYIRGDKPF